MAVPIQLRARPIQRSDSACVRDLRSQATSWERTSPAVDGRIYEFEGRIVAVSWARAGLIDEPTWQPEPLPEIATFVGGDRPALIGCGLLVLPGIPTDVARQIHRLARTLWGDEIGVRWIVVHVPLPHVPGYPPEAIAQQVSAGAIDHPPMEIPLRDGYWPVGICGDDVVLVRRNDAF